MLQTPFVVPKDVSFNDALALTQSLLDRVEKDELSSQAISSAIATLVQNENGARGFFVNYLTSEKPMADNPGTEIVQGLRSSPEIVAELLVKNLAMSAAQALYHRRQENEEMARSSERVRSRTAHLIELVEMPCVYSRCRQLSETAVTGEGSYKTFLERWSYDAEQRQAISQALESVIAQ
jgi:hypothetical protein